MIQNDQTRVHLRISGRVQGVGFRWFVVTEAERLGLRGWVGNTPDGAVELEAEGRTEVIARFRARLEQGPPAARVSAIDELPVGTAELGRGFEIVR